MKVGVRKVRVGIFHAAEREGRRQDEHVVAAPAIGAVKLLRRGDHFLGVGQLARRRRRSVAGSAQTPVRGPKRLEGKVADRDRDHVGRDAVVHAEVEDALAALGDRLLAMRGALITAVSPAGTWIVASQVWRMPGESWVGIQLRFSIAFALAEQERRLLARGLLRASATAARRRRARSCR